jgi:hypothetical protein
MGDYLTQLGLTPMACAAGTGVRLVVDNNPGVVVKEFTMA